MTRPRVAFVLPGGGSAGAAQVGILRALFEAGVVPDVVIGCSVGAINGAHLALDPTIEQVERLAGVWSSVQRSDVFGSSSRTLLRLALRHEHLYEPTALQALITRFCPIGDLSETVIPVHVVTTDLDHGVAKWWTRGPARAILCASACLPGLFPPVRIHGSRHVDGGVLEPVPVARGVDTDARDVYVLGDPEVPDIAPGRRPTALDVLLRAFAISRYSAVPDPLSLARLGQRVVVVPGADTRGIDLRDFSNTPRLIAESHAIARLFLDEVVLGRATA